MKRIVLFVCVSMMVAPSALIGQTAPSVKFPVDSPRPLRELLWAPAFPRWASNCNWLQTLAATSTCAGQATSSITPPTSLPTESTPSPS